MNTIMNRDQIIRENFWNRFFYGDAIERQRGEVARLENLVAVSEKILKSLADCKSLLGLLAIHKDLWCSGFQNENLGPNEYGMFRTKDIATMLPEEVYLGNVFGLWTFTIPEWEEKGHQWFGYNYFGIPSTTTNYEVVLNQYKRLLKKNVESITSDARDFLYNYYLLNPKAKQL